MSHHVLCCVDESPESEIVVSVAMSLAGKFQLELVLVHVAHHSHAPGISASTAGRERLIAEEREDAERLIEQIAVKTGVHARRRAELGTPHKRIVELCHEETAAFVVLGSRGRGGLKASVLGSTSMYVAGNAPCPCVIVPQSVEQLPSA